MAFAATCTAAMAAASSAPASWRLNHATATSTLLTTSSSSSAVSFPLRSSSRSGAILAAEGHVAPSLSVPVSDISSSSSSSPSSSCLRTVPLSTVSFRCHRCPPPIFFRRRSGAVAVLCLSHSLLSNDGYGCSHDDIRRLAGASLPTRLAVGSKRWSGKGFQQPPIVRQTRPRTRGGSLRVQAIKDKVERAMEVGIRVGKQSWDSVVALVPQSVPRPVARMGVGVVGVLVALTLLKALISTVLSIAVFGLLGFVVYRYLGGGGDGSGGQGGGGSSGGMSDDEALAEAKRIMDKYK